VRLGHRLPGESPLDRTAQQLTCDIDASAIAECALYGRVVYA
jgi:hypothetical protein